MITADDADGPADAKPAGECCDCDQPAVPGHLRCGPCQMRRDAQADVAAALAPLDPLFPQYTLATLFFAVTWIGICLGSLKLNPCLGLLLIFLTIPALLRTMALGVREREAGLPPRPAKRLATFFASLGIMFLVLVVSGTIFALAAFAGVRAAIAADSFPDSMHGIVALLAIMIGVLGSFASAAAILWYTRWLGA